MDLISKLQVTNFLGVEDFADKMSFMYSVLILLLCTLMITVKQYLLLDSIFCYVPTTPSGSDFDKFLTNYCWVHGTIPLLPEEAMPQEMDQWAVADEEHRISE